MADDWPLSPDPHMMQKAIETLASGAGSDGECHGCGPNVSADLNAAIGGLVEAGLKGPGIQGSIRNTYQSAGPYCWFPRVNDQPRLQPRRHTASWARQHITVGSASSMGVPCWCTECYMRMLQRIGYDVVPYDWLTFQVCIVTSQAQTTPRKSFFRLCLPICRWTYAIDKRLRWLGA